MFLISAFVDLFISLTMASFFTNSVELEYRETIIFHFFVIIFSTLPDSIEIGYDESNVCKFET